MSNGAAQGGSRGVLVAGAVITAGVIAAVFGFDLFGMNAKSGASSGASGDAPVANSASLLDKSTFTPASDAGRVAPKPAGDVPDNSDEKQQVAALPAPASPDLPNAEPPDFTPDMTAPTPLFDVFYVDPAGNAVVAGRTDPGVEIALMLGDQVFEMVKADSAGEFTFNATLPPSDQPRAIRLRIQTDGAPVFSNEEYSVAPIAAPVVVATGASAVTETANTAMQGAKVAGAAAATDGVEVAPTETATTPVKSDPAATAASDATTSNTAASEPAASEPAVPAAPAVIRSDASGVTVVQPATNAGAQSPQVMSAIALDAITYDDAGEVQLQGRGRGASFARVYLDNAPLTGVRIAPNGAWRLALPDVAQGVYTLRVDEVDSAGRVTSRVETPFKRENRVTLATESDGARVSAITVQPGNTLWAIARDNYGQGPMYVKLFAANRDRIRDPDLIYPGQVFAIPE